MELWPSRTRICDVLHVLRGAKKIVQTSAKEFNGSEGIAKKPTWIQHRGSCGTWLATCSGGAALRTHAARCRSRTRHVVCLLQASATGVALAGVHRRTGAFGPGPKQLKEPPVCSCCRSLPPRRFVAPLIAVSRRAPSAERAERLVPSGGRWLPLTHPLPSSSVAPHASWLLPRPRG